MYDHLRDFFVKRIKIQLGCKGETMHLNRLWSGWIWLLVV